MSSLHFLTPPLRKMWVPPGGWGSARGPKLFQFLGLQLKLSAIGSREWTLLDKSSPVYIPKMILLDIYWKYLPYTYDPFDWMVGSLISSHVFITVNSNGSLKMINSWSPKSSKRCSTALVKLPLGRLIPSDALVWVNYNNSLTWIKAIWDNLPRLVIIH